MRYELSDCEWAAITPTLTNKPRGIRRVNDRRVLNGIFWVLRSEALYRDCQSTFITARPVVMDSGLRSHSDGAKRRSERSRPRNDGLAKFVMQYG